MATLYSPVLSPLLIMQLPVLALSLLLAAAMAQDTYHCPDGWDLNESHGHCGCFLLAGSERVTR